jgi:adenine-specific DNA-methyltransferase
MRSCYLHWESKQEAKEEASSPNQSDTNIPFIRQNTLINGDNLEALKLLNKEHQNKIDVIYIDPPYNTKNHKFIYHDTFKNHGMWLSFIYPRLILACGLLNEGGVIFISIDDNEASHLKLLCDEIFGEENFISQLTWQKKNKASFLHKKIAKVSEYILCYAKDIKKAPMLSVESSSEQKPYPLNFKNNPIKELFFAENSVRFNMDDCTVMASDMSSENIHATLLDNVEIKNGVNINGFKMRGSWRYSQKYIDALTKKGALFSVAKVPFRLNYIKHETKNKLMRNLLTKESYKTETNEDGLNQIVELFGFEAFSKPKPVGLLKTLIKSVTHTKKDALVLDFFAGSGTTAHAVMDLNSEDGGERVFILMQSSEKIKKNSIAYKNGYRNIYEITKDRVQFASKKRKINIFYEIIL